MQNISRRSLLASPILLGGFGSASAAMSQEGKEPHFFLQILIEDGLDSLYLFDSRPKIFTAAGKIANYAKDEAFLWEGAAGGRCWASPLVKPLQEFKSRLAIVNGIVMPPGFLGHEQNVNSLLTANPFGGKYFAPLLSTSSMPLPFVGIGPLGSATLSNRSEALVLDSRTANTLAARAGTKAAGQPDAAWRRFLGDRAKNCAQGPGAFSKGCAAYAQSLEKSRALATSLSATGVSFEPSASDLEKRVSVALSYFRNNLSRTALVAYSADSTVDTHAPADAARSEETYRLLNAEIAAVLKLLEKTPFDAVRGLSMLDVTTVMISTEFSRTHMQMGKTVETTGTDHNPFGNMAIFCGKGIRGDLVLGATDLDVLDEHSNFGPVSNAHKKVDAKNFNRIGKVFDFARQETSQILPEEFKLDDYITMPSIMNTMMAGFGVGQGSWLSNETRTSVESKPAGIISRLLR